MPMCSILGVNFSLLDNEICVCGIILLIDHFYTVTQPDWEIIVSFSFVWDLC